MATSEFEFPHCMHVFSAAMHMQGIDPASVKISMPPDKWWELYSALERQFSGLMLFDGRGPLANEFQYMGFRFVAEKAKPKITKVA